ncbi:MAG: HAD-IIB family hydrolase [Saprospiraceae bacterium]|nr:HAD-IIB family hydrolase [Saprospiraceae bacterium]
MIEFTLTTGRPLVVFTDLDGTLIDHHSYSFEGSEAAIRNLVERKAPLVFCSSKTFAEQIHLQRQIGLKMPFIFENGSAIAIPDGFFPGKFYSATRKEQGYDLVVFAHAEATVLRAALKIIPEIHGYSDASDAELSAATGLRGAFLQRARERWFTETLLSRLDAAQVVRINTLLKPKGFVLSRGGRFYTVQSGSVNKGRAVEWMKGIFRQTIVQDPCFAAIGDSPNDAPMLEVVDLPFLVQKPDHTWADLDLPDLIKLEGVGPEGFSAAVRMLLGEGWVV